MWIKITSKASQLIAQADAQGGIYPNNVYMLSAMRDGNAHNTETLKNKLRLADFDECFNWLLRNNYIESCRPC